MFLPSFVLNAVVWSSVHGGPADQVPQPLLAFARSRERIISGQVSWVRDGLGPLGVRSGVFIPAHKLRFISRYARNGDFIVEQRGNDDGWTMFDGSGTDARGIRRHPQLHLRNT